MADLVAWSTIKVGKPNTDPQKLTGGETEVIKPGDTVTQDGLGLDDDQFRQLVESGAVRALPYPDMPPTYQDSPVAYLREQARIAAEGALNDAQTSEDNINAIMAANAASTGTDTFGEPLPDEVIKEMKSQQDEGAAPPQKTTNQVSQAT